MQEQISATLLSFVGSVPPFLPFSAFEPRLDWGGATQPLMNREFGCGAAWANSNSSAPYMITLWFLLFSSAALLSSAKKWPNDGPLSMLSASVLSLEHKEKNHVLDLVLLFLSFVFSVLLPLIDLLESSKMLETPIRLPSVMLLSWKNDPVDCNIKATNGRVRSIVMNCDYGYLILELFWKLLGFLLQLLSYRYAYELKLNLQHQYFISVSYLSDGMAKIRPSPKDYKGSCLAVPVDLFNSSCY